MKINIHILGSISFVVLCVVVFVWFAQTREVAQGIDETEEFDMGTMVGQNIVVGIPDLIVTDETREILRDIKPGGVVMYRRNYESPEQFKLLVQELQVIAKEDGGTPYFIMLDEEPNGATRLDILQDVFTLGLPDWGSIHRGIEELADLGVNVELCPVADFPFNKDSFIGRRVPVDTPEELKLFNKTFISLLAENNIFATLKHFPGAGVLVEDPHKAIPSGHIDEDIFNQSLLIFEDGINAGAQFVMTNHAVYENIDPDNPATLSYKVVTGLLKDKLNFNGIIITDDIADMLSPVWNIDPIYAGIQSLRAGVTMVIYSHRIEDTY